jgi:hypothetical protein
MLVCVQVSYTQNSDSNKYKKLAKEYISEVIYAAMESCQEDKSDGKLNGAENKGMLQFNEYYRSSSNWEFVDLNEFLNLNSWNGLSKGLLQKWEGILVKDSIDNESNLLSLLMADVVCPYKSGKIADYFELKVTSIQTNYEEKLNKLSGNEDFKKLGSEPNQLESSLRGEIEGEKDNTSSLDALHYLLMLLVVVLAFFCFRFYREKENTKRTIGDLKLKIQDYEGAIFQNGSTKKEVIKTSRKVRSNKGINVLSHDELKNTDSVKKGISTGGNIKRESHDDFKPKPQSVEKVSANQVTEQITREPKREVQDSMPQYKTSNLYFEEFEEGAFVVRSGRKQKSSWSVFCIATTSDNEGNVALLHQDMAQEIITNKEMYLSDTICDVSYQTGGNMSKIISALPGKVRLDGNKWIVTEKVKVVIN